MKTGSIVLIVIAGLVTLIVLGFCAYLFIEIRRMEK